MATKKAAAKKTPAKKAAPKEPESNRKKALSTTESAKGFIAHRSMKDAAKVAKKAARGSSWT